jgi:hypothetical protein
MAVKKISQEQINNVAMMTANNATPTRIARETGLHLTTVKRILEEPATVQQVEQYSKVMAESMLQLAANIVGTIDDATILKAGLRDRVVAAGILQDKARQSYGIDKQMVEIRSVSIRTTVKEFADLVGGTLVE